MPNIPVVVSAVAFVVGVIDLARGTVHTMMLGGLASEKSGLDFTAIGGPEQAVLMTTFGASNLITGAALIMTALFARHIALSLLSVIPAAYLIAGLSLNVWIGGLEATSGRWDGAQLMSIYIPVCAITALYGWFGWRRNARAADWVTMG